MSEKKPTQLMDCVRVVCRQCQLQDSSVRALATFRQRRLDHNSAVQWTSAAAQKFHRCWPRSSKMQATLVAALLAGGAAAHPQRSLPRVGCTTAVTPAAVQSRRSLLRVGCTTTVTPFTSAAACKGDECLMQRRRTFERAGRTLVVDQEFSTAKQRSTGAGVWECGEILSAKLAAEPGLCKGKRCSSSVQDVAWWR